MTTQKSIAEKLGVSRQLVTHALAGYPHVSAASRQRIVAAAERMGYRKNPYARALKRKHSGIVALGVPDQISSHYSCVARELSRLTKAAGYELIIGEFGNRGAEGMLSHIPLDGIILVDVPARVSRQLRSTFGREMPLVSLGACAAASIDSVQVDLRAGTKEVMEHLLELGFRRIVHATFVHEDESSEARCQAYSQAMREAGLLPHFFYYPLSQAQRQIARQSIQEYIRAEGCPEAFFCHSDDAAVGIYRGLCDMKLRVPDDVALVGCDGIEATEYLECPLTTLAQPMAEMCATAWRFLRRRIEQPRLGRQQAVLLPKLLIRESSRRVERAIGGAKLTPRESAVLALLSKGCVDKEIAEVLRISVWTVREHIKNIYERLHVHTRTEAAARWLHQQFSRSRSGRNVRREAVKTGGES